MASFAAAYLALHRSGLHQARMIAKRLGLHRLD